MITNEKDIEERFGMVAIKNGFITKEQLLEAMTEQITSDLATDGHSLLGAILSANAHMTMEQIEEVVGEISKPASGMCPTCGVLLLKCPKCWGALR